MDDNGSELIVEILDGILGEPRKHNESNGQIAYDCPVCSHEIKGLDEGDGKGNLEINYIDHVYQCWACGPTHDTHGHLGKLIGEFGSPSDKKLYKLLRPDTYKKREREYEQVKLPKEYTKFSDVSDLNPTKREPYNYLKARNITDNIIERYDIGFASTGEYAGRIIVPSYDKDGELNFFVGRAYKDYIKPKYMNPDAPKSYLIFNESRIDWTKDIYIVEGVFDCFSLPNSIPLLGKVMSEKLHDTLYDKAQGRIKICLDLEAWLKAIDIYQTLNGGKLYGRIDLIKLPDDRDIAELNGVIMDTYYYNTEKINSF